MTAYVGVDIGTGGVRAVALNEELTPEYSCSRSYAVTSPEPGWAEQDPDEIVSKTVSVMEEMADRHEDVVFCLSSVMHSILAVDVSGDPVSPLLIWADNRAIRETKWLEREYGTDRFYRSTSCPLHPSFWPGKIVWLNRELGGSVIHGYQSIKEYLLSRLTGRRIVDVSVAGSSGLFGLESGTFVPELLKAVRIGEGALSDAVPTTHEIRARVAGREVPIVVGSTDGVLANLGIGAVTPETAVLTVGSSAAVRQTHPSPVFDDAQRTWCYILDQDHYVVGEASNSGGLVVDWFATLLGFDSAKEMTAALLPEVPYEPVDPLLMPTMAGERAPGYQEELRGELIDLGLNAERGDVVTAVVEGIAFFTRFIAEDLARAVPAQPNRTLLTGTLGRARPIRRLAPYLFGSCAEREEVDRSSAVGAAMLGIAARTGACIEEVAGRLPPITDIETGADAEFREYLDTKYKRFREAYRVASDRIKTVEPAGPGDAAAGRRSETTR